MRTVLLLFLISVFTFTSRAQNYGNEWIDYSRTYYKLPIPSEGIYRIDSATLNKYGLGAIDPRNFRLFIKGKEQFLFVNGEADGQTNTGDFVEFYANPNLGDIDSLIYFGIKYVPNPYNPLFNDTLWAFFTWNNSINNKRYQLETDTTSAPHTEGKYFYTEKIFNSKFPYTPNYVPEYPFNRSDPNYTQAEGRGIAFNKGQSVSTNFKYLNNYTASPVPLPVYLSLNYSGASRDDISPNHHIKTYYNFPNNNQVLLRDTIFSNCAPVRQTFTLTTQNTTDSANITLTSEPDAGLPANKTILHYVNLFYPHTLNFNADRSARMVIDNGPGSKTYFRFSNFDYGVPNSVLFHDVTNGKRIKSVIDNFKVRVLVPNGAGRQVCYMSAEADVIGVISLSKVNQGSGTFTNFRNSPAAKPYVIIYHKILSASATDYKNYRSSVAGGSYDVINAEIGELYEQFSCGVNKHPAAIKNFLRFLKDSLPNKPNYVLLVGKAIGIEQLGISNQNLNLVPTMGMPSCDNLLTAALTPGNPNPYYPEIPVGRLAALTNTEVTTYLDKVKEHEIPKIADWKKRVLHFAGGDDEALNSQISAYMAVYEKIIKDTVFGAEVVTFKKNTTQPIQTLLSDSLKKMMNYGSALINFFGHGSPDVLDIAIDDPELFQNKGRYPFFLSNSCESGNIHRPNESSVSQRYVFAKQKGSVGFVATTSNGLDIELYDFSFQFYKALAGAFYDKGVGDQLKEASLKNYSGQNIASNFLNLDMTLHGDPAIRIDNGLLPDYQLANNDVSFDLQKYTDSLGIAIRFKNTGKARGDSIKVRIERFFPSGDSAVIIKLIRAPMFRDSTIFFTPIDFNRGFGLNRFTVEIDYQNRIVESIETNNKTSGTVDLFIPGGDVLPVYPYKFAVVPKTNTIVLKASTTDPFAPLTTYHFQFDTCDKFDNPIKTTIITSKGGVLEWTVNLPFGDSTVYFWRVSRDSVSAAKSFAWRESSFQTVGDKRGWGQSHFHQFKSDAYQFVSYKKDLRKFIFENSKYDVKARTGIHPNLHIYEMNYWFNTQIADGISSTFNGWNFAVFDSISGQPQLTKSINYPATGPGIYNNCVQNGSRLVYSFGNQTQCAPTDWKTDMLNFINSIAPNNYVLAYNTNYTDSFSRVSGYSNALYDAFETLGAKNIRTTKDSIPYILFGRKGMTAGQAHVVAGINKKSVVILTDSIKTKWNSGFVASELIGPSKKWNSLHWRVKSVDTQKGDTTIIKLVGYKYNGGVDTLASFKEDSLDVFNLENYVRADVYPHIKLVALMKDNIFRTSPQLKRWQVLYEEAPECAINPLKGFASINDTLLEGDEVTFKFPIENVGVKNFDDSLVVTYWIEDNARNKQLLPQKLKSKPFVAGQVFIDTVKVNSYQLRGNNALWIFVNPINHTRYQHEQHQFNNIGRFAFKVNQDITNPLLDVTFDGIRILNGDIVSAKPNILISLKDENKFLALNDTGAFSIFLKAPDQNSSKRIFFAQGLQFTPANLPKNSATILYSPTLTVDGKYSLIVQARDRSSNASGPQDYAIQFEVDNKPSITGVMNYPNPFSTNTKFVFTLTGSEIPEVFTIQIMTISGKIVREIRREELGFLHIGRNITDYSWDGRDMFGDRLGNGVYLYRVITKLNGENIEKNESGADRFFTRDFGKMVLMR